MCGKRSGLRQNVYGLFSSAEWLPGQFPINTKTGTSEKSGLEADSWTYGSVSIVNIFVLHQETSITENALNSAGDEMTGLVDVSQLLSLTLVLEPWVLVMEAEKAAIYGPNSAGSKLARFM